MVVPKFSNVEYEQKLNCIFESKLQIFLKNNSWEVRFPIFIALHSMFKTLGTNKLPTNDLPIIRTKISSAPINNSGQIGVIGVL